MVSQVPKMTSTPNPNSGFERRCTPRTDKIDSHFVLLYFFPEVFFHCRVIGACPVTTDWIFRDELT